MKSAKEYFEMHKFPPPGRFVSSDFLEEVKKRFDSLSLAAENAKKRAYFFEEKSKELEETSKEADSRYQELKENPFCESKVLESEDGDEIGFVMPDRRKVYFEGKDPKTSKYDVENHQLRIDKKLLKNQLNRAKKRYHQREETIREIMDQSGLKLVLTNDLGQNESIQRIPYDIIDPNTFDFDSDSDFVYDDDVVVAQINYYKGHLWIHKTNDTCSSQFPILVDGVDLRKIKKKKVQLKINSEIHIKGNTHGGGLLIRIRNEIRISD